MIIFDTLKYSTKLIEAGVPQKQAEAQAHALADLVDDQLTTKTDLQKLDESTKKEVKDLEVFVRNAFVRQENRLLSKLGGLVLICTAMLDVLISMHH